MNPEQVVYSGFEPLRGTPVSWLREHGFTTDFALAELQDPDGDGAPMWMEYLSGTDPFDPKSVFSVSDWDFGVEGFRINFKAVIGEVYRLEYSDDMIEWKVLGDDIVGTGRSVAVGDSPTDISRRFYRIQLEPHPFVPDGMVWILPTQFKMGSPVSEPGRRLNEGPQRTITMSKGFWIGQYEVTQSQYASVMGINPSTLVVEPNRPVSGVAWSDAIEFCKRLTDRERAAGRLPEDYSYNLPTEAQWEYACRAGTESAYSFGSNPNSGMLADYAWYAGNSGGRIHPVGQKKPNAWGLYDMHGNVSEWCLDWLGDYDPAAIIDPLGAPVGSQRVIRGGSWRDDAPSTRSAARSSENPVRSLNFAGFRAVLSSQQ